jgi:hypothetical protein
MRCDIRSHPCVYILMIIYGQASLSVAIDAFASSSNPTHTGIPNQRDSVAPASSICITTLVRPDNRLDVVQRPWDNQRRQRAPNEFTQLINIRYRGGVALASGPLFSAGESHHLPRADAAPPRAFLPPRTYGGNENVGGLGNRIVV